MKRKEQLITSLVCAAYLSLFQFSHGQTGIVMISKKDPIPFDQWFTVKHKKYHNYMELYSYRETCELQLDRILEDYGLDHTTGDLTEVGFIWTLNQGNGYLAEIQYEMESEYGYVWIYVYENDLKELTEIIDEPRKSCLHDTLVTE
jgi:hypothetical protein